MRRKPTTTVFGIDPSSRKLAVVYSVVGDEPTVQYKTLALPQDKPRACLMAFQWVRELVEPSTAVGAVYVAVEMPVFGRGGPGSTIPQAQINGALLAGIEAAGATAILVNNARAKKEVTGHGNINKDGIRQWVKEAWPTLYAEIGKDQDLCDSTMIYVYGTRTIELRNKIERRKNLDGVVVKRRIKRPRRKAQV